MWWWLPLAGLVGAAFIAIQFRRSLGNLMLWGLGNFLVSIFPVIGLLKFGYFQHSFVADHFLYLGLAGLAGCMALALEKTAHSTRRVFRYVMTSDRADIFRVSRSPNLLPDKDVGRQCDTYGTALWPLILCLGPLIIIWARKCFGRGRSDSAEKHLRTIVGDQA